jgi:inner membrane transporter RhtA
MLERRIETAPPHLYFLVSATFHYLGPSFAVLLFARVQVLGVAWLRIVSAALILAAWRCPWRRVRGLDRDDRLLLLAWGATLAVMNACFYTAISRLPLATVSAIEFLPVIALAALGAHSARNLIALALAVPGVYLLTHVRIAGATLGFVFAFANALLFCGYIVLADRVAKRPQLSGIDALAIAMLIASVLVTPIGGWEALPTFTAPVALLAGVGVGISSSVVPYVTDQLAMARLPRATYATMVALLPAIATVIGIVVLTQIPSPVEAAGLVLVIAGVATHRPADTLAGGAVHRPADTIAGRSGAPACRHDRRKERCAGLPTRSPEGRHVGLPTRSPEGRQAAPLRPPRSRIVRSGRPHRPERTHPACGGV